MDASELNIHAIVRIRAPESSEKKDIIYAVSPDHKEIQLSLRETEHYAFTFDRIIDPFVTNVELFESTARSLVDKLIVCKNACLISYGEPNCKNDCVFGVEITNRDSKGLIFRCLTYLFNILDRYTATKDFKICLGLYEIYLDKIRDMGRAYLDRLETGDWQHSQFASSNLNLVEREGRTDIENLAMIPISNIDEAMSLIQMGLELRQSYDSRNNRQSIKSHTFLNISLAQKYKSTTEVFTSVLTFAALGYQEKTPKSLIENLKKQETYFLNASMMALEKVLNNLFQRREAKTNGEIPYKDNKLTRILQNVCNTESQTLLLVTLPPTAKNLEEAVRILQFAERCFKIEREKKKKSILAALAPISGQQLERVRRLEDEVNELKSQIDKGQTSHELKLKAFAKLIGVENDLEAILQAPPGSKERNIARNYKEAITKLDNITKRNLDLERKLEDNKKLFEEIKRVELNNQDKFAREVYELESQITDLRGQIQELKEKTENSARDQLHERAEELQKLLIHSHMLLEEQAAVIHNLPFNMNSRAADLRNMSDMRDLGRSEVEHELKKKFRDEELAQQKRIANITEQYNYILDQKQKEINQFILESREYDRKKK
jgi:hypothetical protein